LAERDRKLLRDDASHGIDAAAGRIRTIRAMVRFG